MGGDHSSATGPARVWMLAAGGMVGGGIYVTLGIVVSVAGPWAWLSFVLAGIVAITSAASYARLSRRFGKSGGAFEFLEALDHKGIAGSLSWLLILGYMLAIAVYAHAFGEYVAYALGAGEAVVHALIVALGIAVVALNMAGLGKATAVQIAIVTGNLLALVLLGGYGLAHWQPAMLGAGMTPASPLGALAGAAGIFVSYEGFQLLTYDYANIRRAERSFVGVLVSAAAAVMCLYVAVALGATMLTGAGTVAGHKQIALAIAAERAGGQAALDAMTIVAAIAIAGAINATLFSTGKLAARVCADGELPAWLARRNRAGIPARTVLLAGTAATVLALAGSLSALVETASMVFLATFLTVNLICWCVLERYRWAPALALGLGGALALILVARLYRSAPLPLVLLLLFAGAVFTLRPAVLHRTASASRHRS